MLRNYILIAAFLMFFFHIQKAAAEEVDFKKATKPKVYTLVLFRPDDPIVRGIDRIIPPVSDQNSSEDTNSPPPTATTATTYSATDFQNSASTTPSLIPYVLQPQSPTEGTISAIYPNPVYNWANLNVPSNKPIYINIFNLKGQSIWSETTETTGPAISINLDHLPNGIYVVKVECNGAKHVEKIQVTH